MKIVSSTLQFRARINGRINRRRRLQLEQKNGQRRRLNQTIYILSMLQGEYVKRFLSANRLREKRG